MNFDLTTLGVASASPTVSRYPSAHVLNVRGRLFLIDCGEAAQMLLKRNGISPFKIREIFISHLHGDHVFGIFGLLSSMSLKSRGEALRIFAPARFASVLESFVRDFGEELSFPIEHVVVDASAAQAPVKVFETDFVDVFAFPLQHRVETYGYLFREKCALRNVRKDAVSALGLSYREIVCLKSGEDVLREDGTLLRNEDLTYLPFRPRSFAYCSDTAPFDELPQWLLGTDLIYHEATFLSEHADIAAKTCHSTAAQAAMSARLAGVSRLVMGHFSARYQDLEPFLAEARAVFPESYLASEGECFSIPCVRGDD